MVLGIIIPEYRKFILTTLVHFLDASLISYTYKEVGYQWAIDWAKNLTVRFVCTGNHEMLVGCLEENVP